MSFYITLPSNSPNNTNGNTQSSYTTLLGSPLHLKGAYKVALSDINFTKNFNFDLGYFDLLNSFDDIPTRVYLNIENGLSLENFCTSVNQQRALAHLH